MEQNTTTIIQTNSDQPITQAPLEEKLYDNTTIGDLIKKSAESIDFVETEAKELYTRAKKKSEGGEDDMLLYGQDAKEFLELLATLSDSRSKLLTATATLLRAKMPSAMAAIYQGQGAPSGDSRGRIDLSDAKDPLEASMGGSRILVTARDPEDERIEESLKKELDEDQGEQGDSQDDSRAIKVIHSPSYGKKYGPRQT